MSRASRHIEGNAAFTYPVCELIQFVALSKMSESPSNCMAIARLIALLVRLRALPLAELDFRFSRNFEPGDYSAVPYLGYRLPLELSRSVTHRLLYLEGERFVAESQFLKKSVSKIAQLLGPWNVF